jgi:hypothetical protein
MQNLCRDSLNLPYIQEARQWHCTPRQTWRFLSFGMECDYFQKGSDLS